MAIPLSYYLGSVLEKITGLSDVEAFLQQINIDDSFNLLVKNAVFKITTEATIFTVDLSAVHQKIDLSAFPGGIGTLSVRLGDEHGKMSLSVAADLRSVECDSLHLVYSAKTDLLRPLDPETAALEVSFAARVIIYSDFAFEVIPDLTLDVGPAYLGATDIIVQLEGLKPEFSLAGSPLVLNGIAVGGDFRGVYVRSGYIRVLNDYVFGNEHGVQVNFKHFAFTASGISGTIHSYWQQGISTTLFGVDESAWELELKSLQADIRNSFPQEFRIYAAVKLPLMPVTMNAAVSLNFSDAGKYRLDISNQVPILFDFGFGSLQVEVLAASGAFSSSDLNLSGACQNVNLVSDALSLSVVSASVKLQHSDLADKLSIAINQVDLGSFVISNASLVLEKSYLDDQQSQLVYIEGAIEWRDLSSRISLPDNIPLPPDDASISLKAHWEQQSDSSYQFKFYLHFVAEDVDSIWAFIPQAFRPEVSYLELIFGVTAATDTEVQLDVGGRIDMVLPQLSSGPISDQIKLSTGNDQGVISCAFTISSEGKISLSTTDLLELAICLPGGLADAPFIENRLTQFALEAALDEAAAPSASMKFEGDFAFRPLVPSAIPFAANLNALLGQAGLSEIRGASTLALTVSESAFDLTVAGAFEALGIEIDIFHLLSSLSSGGAAPTGKEIDIDFDVGFKLIGFKFNIGNLPQDDAVGTGDFYFAFDLKVECTMTGIPPVQAAITLSSTEFSFGIEQLSIPVMLPKYPIDVGDLDRLEHEQGQWSLVEGTPGSDYIVELQDRATALSEQISDPATTDADKQRLTRELSAWEIKRLMLEITMAIHRGVVPGGDDSISVYQSLVIADTWIHSSVLNLLHFDANLNLFFPEIKFRIPFDDPTGISVAGSGKLVGFSDSDPLKALEDCTFSLSLTAEHFFAEIKSSGEPIPLPSFGTAYDDGTVSVSKFRIGYGYSSNSFAVDFAGEMVIPTQLINDANTSAQLGFGVKLPRHNKLAFQLDISILTVGKFTIPIPIPRFDLDLRTPNAPDLLSTNRVEPYWDGLELIAQNLFHVDLKRVAFSPMFGFAIIPNIKYDGDFKFGDDQNGLTLIVNDLLILLGTLVGTYGIMPVPFFASPEQPYFKNLAANLRVMGFEVNFNLERPFPSASPMALLEVFGLISNPNMEIDQNGSLANTVRFSITDAYLKVPDAVLRMFPEAANLVNQRYSYTLNLGTLIALTQSVFSTLKPAFDQTLAFMENASQSLEDLQNNLPTEFDPWALMALLPAELRTIKLSSGNLGGFAANTCFVLTTEQEARAALEAKNDPLSLTDERPNVKEGKRFAQYENYSRPTYTPTSSYDYADSWTRVGAAGEWTEDDGVISRQGPLNGIAYNIYDKSIPEKINLTFRVASPTNQAGAEVGVVFEYTDTNNYYLLKSSGTGSQLRRVSLRRKKGGNFATVPLFEKTLHGLHSDELDLEFISWLDEGKRIFVVNLLQGADHRSTIGRGEDSSPLENGRIGLYAKNTAWVQFEEMAIYELNLRFRSFGEIDGQHFNVNLPASKLDRGHLLDANDSRNLLNGDEFAPFNASHLDLIPVDKLPHPVSAGIIMSAEVMVLDSQQFTFLGKLYEDGSFALVSAVTSGPLNLSVFGLDVSIPFEAYGNLIIAGWPSGVGYEAYVEANGFFVWEPYAGLIKIEVGSAADPSSLRVQSNGQFHLSTSAAITLFKGAAVISAQAKISDQRCVFSGKLNYAIGDSVGLKISGAGGLGQRPMYWFDGAGELSLFGQRFLGVEVQINDTRAKLAFDFNTSNLPGLAFLDPTFEVALSLRGEIDISQKKRPAFGFSGTGKLSAFGAEIGGVGEVKAIAGKTARSDALEMSVGGKLSWQDTPWLQGLLRINSRSGVHLEGHTHFGLELTPGMIGGMQVANLFFRINLGGSVNFRTNGRIVFDMKMDWSLGVKLPGNDEQMLPLASSSIVLKGGLASPLTLVNLDGFKLLPIDGFNITLPIPEIKGAGSPVLKIGAKNKKVALNVPELGTFYLDEKDFITGLKGGKLPSLIGGSLPSINGGNLPNLNPGSLPSLSKGSLPGLSINFLTGTFAFSKGRLPSLSNGSLPVLDAGSLPTLNAGALPQFKPGSFPTANMGKIPFPAFASGEHFDQDSNTTPIYSNFEVNWKDQTLPIDFSAFKDSPIKFGYDRSGNAFYLEIGANRYRLNGEII